MVSGFGFRVWGLGFTYNCTYNHIRALKGGRFFVGSGGVQEGDLGGVYGGFGGDLRGFLGLLWGCQGF